MKNAHLILTIRNVLTLAELANEEATRNEEKADSINRDRALHQEYKARAEQLRKLADYLTKTAEKWEHDNATTSKAIKKMIHDKKTSPKY